MEKIKVLERFVKLEKLEKLEKPDCDVSDMYSAERAVICDALSGGGAKVIIDTAEAYAVETDGALFCIADNVSALTRAVDVSANRGDRKIVMFLKERDESQGAPCSVYAYLNAMPILPSGDAEIKRLAPTLAKTVTDALGGYDVDDMAALMRQSGVYGAITGGKLVGFIGRTKVGGMDIYRVYDSADKHKVGEQLTKFLSTLIMTCGRIPFAFAGEDDERRSVLTACGLTAGRLFAYVV